MSVRFSELHYKEVICIGDGRRLGFVCDACVELPEGRLTAIVVPGPCRVLNFWGRRDDFVIPWNCIRRIGPDIVLVDVKPDQCRVPRNKPRLLF